MTNIKDLSQEQDQLERFIISQKRAVARYKGKDKKLAEYVMKKMSLDASISRLKEIKSIKKANK